MSIEITAPSNLADPVGYYSKQLMIFGVPILATNKVDDEALYAAAEIIGNVIINNDLLRANVVYLGEGHNANIRGIKIGVIDETESITEMPEFAFLKGQTTPDGRGYSGLRGLGGTPMSSAGEENLLNYPTDPYRGLESIMLHEFIHGVEQLLPTFAGKITQTYNHAVAEGLWDNTYAITNQNEYFAELTQTWFNDNPHVPASDGTNHPVNTRAELKIYDRDAYDFLDGIFRNDSWTDGNFFGAKTADQMLGTGNSDLIFGRGGDDEIISGFGHDTAYGDAGEDMLFSTDGVNMLDGGVESDFLFGGMSIDTLVGGSGNDIIRGESDGAVIGGADNIVGGRGNDILMGGKGSDNFTFNTNDGADVIGMFKTKNVTFVDGVGFGATVIGADFKSGFDEIILDGFVNINAGNLFDFINDVAGNAVFNTQGTQITFYDVLESQLATDDFVFIS